MDVYIGTEGFTLPSGFIAKEMTICHSNREYRHLFFKPPYDYTPTEQDLHTIRYTSIKLNQLSFTDGDTPYECISIILDRYKDCTIYCYGTSSANLLQSYLKTTTIINIQDRGFKLPSVLPKPNCFKNHNPRYCSFAKALKIRQIVENGQAP